MRIVLCYPVEKTHLTHIATIAPAAEIIDAGQVRVAEELNYADIFCGHPKVPVNWEYVVAQKRLRWIQSSAAGLDHLLVPSVVESEIIVTSASGVLSDQVAEHCVALVTAWMRNLPVFFQAQKNKEFIRRPTRDLHGATVGIVGFGGVGRRIAEVMRSFKTTILAVDYFPFDRPDYVQMLAGPDELDSVLGKADVLVLSAPLTQATRGIINRNSLKNMKPGSLLVNMARGQLVVERDLVDALESGHLAGAVMDVTETEPLPAASPLWHMPQVIITPHVAGQSKWRSDRMTEFFGRNLSAYFKGVPLENVVDKRLGFPDRVGNKSITPL